MILKECKFIENECYKAGERMESKPYGIVLHSTAANNPYLKRYVQPVMSQEYYYEVIRDLGKNIYDNHWNNPSSKVGRKTCVHSFIGLNANKVVETYEVLPHDICCWGCGSGKNGSFNYNPTPCIQIEICEDDLTDRIYFDRVFKEAIEYCGYLCELYDIPTERIYSHDEAQRAGYAVAHVDPTHWMSKFGKNMKWFRDEVNKFRGLDPDNKFYTVQLGAFNHRENAEALITELKKKGITECFIKEYRK